MSVPLEDYALIGDCQTAALVGRDGSIDWLCWPDFGSPACFARLLGGSDNGFWRLAPAAGGAAVARRYQDQSLILESTFRTDSGVAVLTDFMPVRDGHPDLVRLVRGVDGTVTMCLELVVRFGYGSVVPWVRHTDEWIAIGGPDLLVLRTPVRLESHDFTTTAEFTVGAGETVPFVLTHGPSHLGVPRAIEPEAALGSTRGFWQEWIRACSYDGAYRSAVERSLITLKALTYRPTGGIVAAPTTSLPEAIGGPRNWDYRYCWLRDATFTLLALLNAGHREEARDWMQWLLRAVAGDPARMQVLYDIRGGRHVPEWTADWLAGYERSRPVRIGNAAASQLQLDVFGEVADAFFHALGGLGRSSEMDFAVISSLIEHLEQVWEQPDHGIWEMRGAPRHFTHSRVMAWVAFDRAIRLADDLGVAAPRERWCRVRDRIHEDVCRRGYDADRGTFVQAYDGTALDASLLLMPLVGFLPHDDPRVRRTVEAIERELTSDGLVRRYDPGSSQDGLPGEEGVFLACSCWMASNLAFMGRRDDAARLFERVVGLANDVGLLAEEYDVERTRLCGNFPQALSHIALVNAAFDLARAGQAHDGHSHRTPAR